MRECEEGRFHLIEEPDQSILRGVFENDLPTIAAELYYYFQLDHGKKRARIDTEGVSRVRRQARRGHPQTPCPENEGRNFFPRGR